MVDSWYCLDQVVPEGMGLVSKRSELRPQHPAIFWHFCGNFHSVRQPLHKLPQRRRYEKRTWHVFCVSLQKGLENRSSRFEPKISWIFFSRGSDPPLKRKVSFSEYSLFYRAFLQMRPKEPTDRSHPITTRTTPLTTWSYGVALVSRID